jgi:hypothetical protein
VLSPQLVSNESKLSLLAAEAKALLISLRAGGATKNHPGGEDILRLRLMAEFMANRSKKEYRGIRAKK